jgi:hypothetical protein
MSGSSSDTRTENQYQTNNESITFGVEGDNPNAINGDGNSINIQSVAPSIIDRVLDFGTDSMFSASDAVRDAGDIISDNSNRAFDFGSDAILDTTNALKDVSSQAFDMGGQVFSDAQSAVVNATNSANDLAMMTVGENADMAEKSVNAASDNLNSSLDFADRQTDKLTSTLGENSELLQQTFLQMGDQQERALDSAMTVAYNVSRDDTAGFATDSVKWIAGAMAVGVAAMAFANRG